MARDRQKLISSITDPSLRASAREGPAARGRLTGIFAGRLPTAVQAAAGRR